MTTKQAEETRQKERLYYVVSIVWKPKYIMLFLRKTKARN